MWAYFHIIINYWSTKQSNSTCMNGYCINCIANTTPVKAKCVIWKTCLDALFWWNLSELLSYPCFFEIKKSCLPLISTILMSEWVTAWLTGRVEFLKLPVKILLCRNLSPWAVGVRDKSPTALCQMFIKATD